MIKFGIVDPAGKYINVFCKDNEGYFHNLSYSKNTVASYKYDNDKKIMETKNFYNKAFKSYRTLIFDLSSGEPVESRVSFLNGNYSLIQEIGSDYFVNINKNPDERNSEEKFIGEFTFPDHPRHNLRIFPGPRCNRFYSLEDLETDGKI